MLQALLLIVALLIIGRLLSEGRGRRFFPKREDKEMARELAELRARVETLERLLVDPARRLQQEIDRLDPKPEEPDGEHHPGD